MIRKTPVIGYSIPLSDITAVAKEVFSDNGKENFEETLASFIPAKHVFLTNSGISAFYIVLETLKRNSSKREVILPAYTAGSLVVAIRKAGLKPVLCDIALSDFNINIGSVRNAITSNTLCIVCVHLFGIPMSGIKELKGQLPDDIFLVEDCAQSMGSTIDGVQTGTSGDISIFSFNRGKNFPTFSGGAVTLNSGELSDKIKTIINEWNIPGLISEASLFLKFIAMSAVFKPFVYTLLYPLISSLKENSVPADFTVTGYSLLQARIGTVLFNKFENSCIKRYENGMKIIGAIENTEGFTLPEIGDTFKPAFNRFPLVVNDLERKKIIENALWKQGIENSPMYIKPIHHHFDLGYEKDAFENAVYFANHLITLPVHSMLTDKYINKIITTVLGTK